MTDLVAFDFDKTLTYKDTLLGFFMEAAGKPSLTKGLKLARYFASMVLTKLQLISNDELKRRGVLLFLKGKTKEEIAHIGKRYAQSIRLNNIYNDTFLHLAGQPLIISASFVEYLRYIFPEESIVASALTYENDIVTGLCNNCYGAQKVIDLKSKNIIRLKTFYTDSLSDQPVIDIADEAYLIKGEALIRMK